MDSEHALQLIPDYVLGLLSADESRRVEQHAHHCFACREAIRRERQIGVLLRQTVQTAARPPIGRLEQLRPAPRRVAHARGQLYRQLAPLTALAVLLVVVLLGQTRGLGRPTPAFAQTAEPATATMTRAATPTVTLAALDTTTANPTATLTRAARSSVPALALAAPPPPDTSADGRPAAAANRPAAAATPIITYAR
ncbi:MAG: zf-HC2 domain-containing protein [Candidatus Promineofilum sp.]|nr:zf-HC2 domain-containing protein [Promineifilum sp.]